MAQMTQIALPGPQMAQMTQIALPGPQMAQMTQIALPGPQMAQMTQIEHLQGPSCPKRSACALAVEYQS
jgi:hypothetical protein